MYLVFLKILDKVRNLEEMISFMESGMYKVRIHGMLLDAFMVNPTKKKFNLTMTWENQLNQIVETL